MDDLWIRLLLAHGVGDYLFQWQTMALAKSQPGAKGLAYSLIHAAIYTFFICLFLWTVNPLFILLIFISHWPIDRWSLGQKWMDLVKSRNVLRAAKTGDPVDVAFSALVYAITDGTIHLFLIWAIIRLIGV